METNFMPRPCRLTTAAGSYAPEAIVRASDINHVYAVGPEKDGSILVSTHSDPAGHVCSHVSARHLVYLD